jgi:hypothetical protein
VHPVTIFDLKNQELVWFYNSFILKQGAGIASNIFQAKQQRDNRDKKQQHRHQ